MVTMAQIIYLSIYSHPTHPATLMNGMDWIGYFVVMNVSHALPLLLRNAGGGGGKQKLFVEDYAGWTPAGTDPLTSRQCRC